MYLVSCTDADCERNTSSVANKGEKQPAFIFAGDCERLRLRHNTVDKAGRILPQPALLHRAIHNCDFPGRL